MADLKINVNDNVRVKDALRLHHKSGEKLKSRNKPVKEVEQYVDDGRSQIITRERAEEETKIYHEGKILRNGGWVIHNKHLKSIKKHKHER